MQEGSDYPAVWVSWNDAVEFCRKLSEQEGVEYRLPTEAQWEYTCRAGTTTVYSFGDDRSKLRQYAWSAKDAFDTHEQYAHRVGQKLPNSWGLYDMHGNVFEWCQDWRAPFGSVGGFLNLTKKQGGPLYKALYEEIASLQTVARRRVFMRTIAVQVKKNGTNGTHSQAFCGR